MNSHKFITCIKMLFYGSMILFVYSYTFTNTGVNQEEWKAIRRLNHNSGDMMTLYLVELGHEVDSEAMTM